jgi:hypothetical protein
MENTVKRSQPITEPDLFALLVGSPGIGNAHFKYADSLLGKFGNQFGFYPEASFINSNSLNHLPAKYLITAFHIGEVQIGKHVGKLGQELVAQRMPVIQYPVAFTGSKTRPESLTGFVWKVDCISMPW